MSTQGAHTVYNSKYIHSNKEFGLAYICNRKRYAWCVSTLIRPASSLPGLKGGHCTISVVASPKMIFVFDLQ